MGGTQKVVGTIGVVLVIICAYGAYGIFRTARLGQTERTRNLILSELKLLPLGVTLLFATCQNLSVQQTMKVSLLASVPGALLSLLQLLGVVKFEGNPEGEPH